MPILSYAEAAHLLRRAGFGGTTEEIESLARRGREKAVDYLVDYEELGNGDLDRVRIEPEEFAQFNFFVDGQMVNGYDLVMRHWWIVRMVLTPRPLEEKMTLFWHNHFATSVQKVPPRMMFAQNHTLRKYALDRFDTLLLKVAQDPAMLLWLDGTTNVVGSPNENFAREVAELFTTGIRDAVTDEITFTEKDVKEIARAFTGWRYKKKKSSPNSFRFVIKSKLHDHGLKEIFGQQANFGGEDVIEVLAARPSTPRFLVKKLFEFFVYPLTESDEDKATMEKFAGVYLNNNHSMRELVRAILVSDHFFSPRAQNALIKFPVELMVGPIRMLGAASTQVISLNIARAFYTLMRKMGFDLFNPPDVSGWDLDLGWINTSTILERYNAVNYLATSRDDKLGLTNDLLARYVGQSARQTVENFLSALVPVSVDEETVQSLVDYLQTDDQGNHVEFSPTQETIDKMVRGLFFLTMCLQEFQLK